MKKFLLISIMTLLMLVLSMTSQVIASEPLKIGIVDLNRTLNESEAGKKARATLESVIKSKQTGIDEKGKSIEALRTELEKQAALLSADAKKVKEEELERLIRDYQRMISDAQAEVQKKQRELEGDILKDLNDVISKIAQEEKYSLILEQREGGILFASKVLDITDRVIKKYNESKAKPAKK